MGPQWKGALALVAAVVIIMALGILLLNKNNSLSEALHQLDVAALQIRSTQSQLADSQREVASVRSQLADTQSQLRQAQDALREAQRTVSQSQAEAGPTKSTALKPGTPVHREESYLARGSSSTILIDLKQNEQVQGKLTAGPFDVQVRILDPAGKVAQDLGTGREKTFTIAAATAGVHSLAINNPSLLGAVSWVLDYTIFGR